jgi:cobalt-zinc-cadmium efflux system outer membrane protein
MEAGRTTGIALVAIAALLCALSGCSSVPCGCDRTHVSADLADRTSQSLGPIAYCGEIVLPNGSSLDDGLLEDEAVLIALWNNAAFQELLTDIGIAQGDLVQAGLLPNPEFVYLFPVTDKPYRYLVDFPIEALWLRPIRVAAAEAETYRVCQRLSQAGLDLMRDVRQAYADVLLAEGRVRVGEEAIRLRQQIANLAQVRLDAGDISAQELATARIDVLTAEQDLVRLQPDVALAQERLLNLLGLGLERPPLVLHAPPTPEANDLNADSLAAEAIETRPDALSAAENAAAAAERLRLAKTSWFRVLGILDATSGMRTGHEFGPGLRMTLPIFQGNEGGIARAEAEWERAERGRVTVRDRIIMDVHLAHERYAQSRAEMDYLRAKVIPEVAAAIDRAELAYREGDAPYIVALQTTRQLIDARFRQEQLTADLHRAWAELERSVGRRLDDAAPDGVGSHLRPTAFHLDTGSPHLTPDPFPPARPPTPIPAENDP